MARVLQFLWLGGSIVVTGMSQTLALWVALAVPMAAFAHGGDGIDHSNAAGLAQMPSSLSDTGGGSGGFGAPTASAKPTIIKIPGESSGASAGGAPATEINDAPVSSGPAPLAQPGKVPANTVRSVPDVPGTNKQALTLNHTSFYLPRAESSQQIYEKAYNADVSLMNVWLKSLGR